MRQELLPFLAGAVFILLGLVLLLVPPKDFNVIDRRWAAYSTNTRRIVYRVFGVACVGAGLLGIVLGGLSIRSQRAGTASLALLRSRPGQISSVVLLPPSNRDYPTLVSSAVNVTDPELQQAVAAALGTATAFDLNHPAGVWYAELRVVVGTDVIRAFVTHTVDKDNGTFIELQAGEGVQYRCDKLGELLPRIVNAPGKAGDAGSGTGSTRP